MKMAVDGGGDQMLAREVWDGMVWWIGVLDSGGVMRWKRSREKGWRRSEHNCRCAALLDSADECPLRWEWILCEGRWTSTFGCQCTHRSTAGTGGFWRGQHRIREFQHTHTHTHTHICATQKTYEHENTQREIERK